MEGKEKDPPPGRPERLEEADSIEIGRIGDGHDGAFFRNDFAVDPDL
jgi:hypothetical protein